MTISRWEGEIASSFFQVIQWLANGWIIGQCCFYHLPLKEWMTYYQFKGEKRVQRPSLRFFVLRLSSFTIAALVELILWNSVLPHIVWIESHLLDFTSVFFFDLMEIACLNSYLNYNMKHPNTLSLLDYKIFVAKNLIQYHQGRKRTVPMSRPCKRKNQPESIDNNGWHLPDYQTMQKWCAYCAMESKENRTFVICLACNITLCLVKDRNCIEKKSITFRST